MASYTDEQFDRLPKWAQHEIQRLTDDLASAHKQLATGPEHSRVFADPLSDTPRPLGTSTIRFTWPHAEELGEVYADVRLSRTGHLVIMTNDGMALSPRSGNVIELRPVSRQTLDELDAANEMQPPGVSPPRE